ncbi:MAG: hypothetical protein RMJ19_06300, partial [Gemmatales bacterium]|nr:hypothetical protein [Gemmatales bacterium]MDW8175265.1 hypothetical protein [Gemmatales bacterium]
MFQDLQRQRCRSKSSALGLVLGVQMCPRGVLEVSERIGGYGTDKSVPPPSDINSPIRPTPSPPLLFLL